jgi:hypothetical protein
MARPERKFYFRLAAHLGMTVRELLSRLDSRELSEWIAYYNLDPFGEARADYRAAMLACLTANINRGKHEPFKISDFMPNFEPKKPQTMEEMKRILMSISRPADGSH